jgi:hypothetical protein
VGIGDHQLDPVELPGLQRPQEGDPEGPVFAVADLDTEDFPVAVAGHAGGHYHRLGHDPAAGTGLDVGGIEEHVGELDVAQRPVPERSQRLVELPADPGDLGLADPRPGAQGGDEIVDLAGRDAVDVGLHHHRVEGPVDPPAPIEDAREEAAMAQLRDRQVHIPGLRRQQARPGAVALVGPRVGPLMGFGADERGCFGIDEGLEDHLHALADQVDVTAGAQRVEQLGQVKLVEGHRVDLLVFLGRFTQRFTRWPTSTADPIRTYTTPGDVTAIGLVDDDD